MKTNFIVFILLIAGIITGFSCSEQGKKTSQSDNTPLAADEDYLITISTDYGDIQVILYDETPKHKENFIKLIKEGYYDDLLFHRVIKSFMIQGGDPKSKGATPDKRLGDGNPGYDIDAEIKEGLLHKKGALAAARLGDAQNPYKKSNGSQFYLVQGKKYTKDELIDLKTKYKQLYYLVGELFKKDKYAGLKNEYMAIQQERDNQKIQQFLINCKGTVEKEFNVKLDNPLSDKEIEIYTTIGGTPQLDSEYTVFGQAITGLDVIDKIAEVKTGMANRPMENVSMKITFKKMKKSKIEALMKNK